MRQITDRELEIMLYRSYGFGNAQIGGLLGISEHTVRTHIQNALLHLHVHDQTHAVAFLIRWGLLPLDPDYMERGDK